MSFRLIHCVRGTIAAMLFPLTLSAAQAVTPDLELAPVVVVATRQPSRMTSVPADISVVEREQIEAAGPAATLGDLLSTLPGIELSREGNRGTGEGIFIRGANSGHTLVLVNDMRVSSATLGTTAVEAIPLAQIQRIEILRGSSSALYGSEAIGGVIRIFTRHDEDAPRLDARVGIGSEGSRETALAHAGRFGDVSYGLRMGEKRAAGVNTITNTASPAYNADKDGYWRRHFAFDVHWQIDARTDVGVGWLNSDGMSRYDSSWPAATDDFQTRLEMSSLSAHVRRKINDIWSTEIRFGRSEDDSVFTPSATFGQARDTFRTRQDQLAWQNDLRLPLGRAMVAFETLREEVTSTNVYTRNNRNTDSLVVGWNGDIGAHFWQLGARRDDNSQFGGKTTHTLGYGYRFAPGWRLSANAGTAFKAPTFNDLYFPYTVFVGGGNPALVPETSRSRELALHYANKVAEISFTAFRNDIRNLIQWEEFPLGSFEYFPANIGFARITGLTAAGKLRVREWNLSAHLTVQSPKNRDTGEYLVRRAKHHGAIAASRDWNAWSFGMEIKGASKRHDAPDFTTRRNTRNLSGYALANLRGEYRFDTGWSVFARIDNLFDRDYELARASTSEYASLGRSMFVGLRFLLQ